MFEVVISRRARLILEQLLCARARELIDEQLNERFRQTGAIVSLAKLVDIDMFGLMPTAAVSSTNFESMQTEGIHF